MKPLKTPPDYKETLKVSQLIGTKLFITLAINRLAPGVTSDDGQVRRRVEQRKNEVV